MLVTIVTTLPSVTMVYKDNYNNVSNHSNPINIGNQDNVWNQSSHKCMLVLMQSISHFCSILNKP